MEACWRGQKKAVTEAGMDGRRRQARQIWNGQAMSPRCITLPHISVSQTPQARALVPPCPPCYLLPPLFGLLGHNTILGCCSVHGRSRPHTHPARAQELPTAGRSVPWCDCTIQVSPLLCWGVVGLGAPPRKLVGDRGRRTRESGWDGDCEWSGTGGAKSEASRPRPCGQGNSSCPVSPPNMLG